MSQITKEQVIKLVSLARLRLSEKEIEQYRVELESILEYVEQLSKVDTEGLQPTNQVTGLVNVFRNDDVADYDAKPDELLNATPKSKDRYIQVKRMI